MATMLRRRGGPAPLSKAMRRKLRVGDIWLDDETNALWVLESRSLFGRKQRWIRVSPW